MPRTWSTDDVVAVLEHLGFSRARRESEDTYTRPGHPRTVSVPRNRREITRGTLGSIFRQAGVTKKQAEEILEAL